MKLKNMTSSRETYKVDSASTNDYKVYRRRWFLLATLFVLNISNAMAWLAFAPVAYKAAEFYTDPPSLDTINWLSVVFMITGIPCGIVATWLIDTVGLRFSVILSAWLNGIGCVIRVISAIDGIAPSAKLPLVFTGQIVAALAQPFVLFAPTKLSALWFKEDQRAISNMLATTGNPLGMMIANIISPILTNKPTDMLYMLAIQCIPAGVAVIMATFGWWSSLPPSPPSSSADAESQPFLVGLKALARNRRYYLLAWAIGGGIALFSVLTTLLSQILCPWGYTDTYVGVACGSALIGAGFVGSAIAGVIVDKTKRFTEVTKVCYALAVVALIVFAVMHNQANQWVVLTCMCGLFGFFSLPVYPIGNELAVETTYPVGEATSSGIVFMSGQLQGLILILLLQSIGTNLDPKPTTDQCTSENLGDIPVQDMSVPVYVMAGYGGLIVLIYTIFFRTEYKRLLADKCKKDSEDSLEKNMDNAAYIQENETDQVEKF
ncbi:solute carrier family 49 member A3-like isoform X2 [Clavelina lepadiformis]|uniref:Major facilitator superfamily (MFS) profile domain-containing protein n=1 Tax=Clavelina lepadiformis TaxID=159417 RepID=A0ABP0FHV5_CLALP